jgi:hypothetical protein
MAEEADVSEQLGAEREILSWHLRCPAARSFGF